MTDCMPGEPARACRDCGKTLPHDEFVKSRGGVSSCCKACRGRRAAQHRRAYYAGLGPDKRHTLTHKRRAETYGVAHEEYSRIAVAARWSNTCAYCDSPFDHMDHVVPLSRTEEAAALAEIGLSVGDVEGNALPACRDCNLSKGALTLAEWALRDFGPPF